MTRMLNLTRLSRDNGRLVIQSQDLITTLNKGILFLPIRDIKNEVW